MLPLRSWVYMIQIQVTPSLNWALSSFPLPLPFPSSSLSSRVSQVVLGVKNPPTSARDVGSVPGWGRSPGGGHGNPLQYSCLENPLDREAWWATVHGVTKSRIWLKRLNSSIPNPPIWTVNKRDPLEAPFELRKDPLSPMTSMMPETPLGNCEGRGGEAGLIWERGRHSRSCLL